jgi:AraC-like DNA-binding protein
MKHWYQQPDQSISAHVRTILILDGSSAPSADAPPLFTNGMPALVCHKVPDGTIRELSLYGNSIPEEALTTDNNSCIIIYFFKSFALASLFDISATVLAKNPVDLGNWNPHQTNALRTQLVYADTAAARVEILNNLLKHLQQQHGRECEIVQYATDYIMCHPDEEPLDAVLKNLSLNKRTFQRIFKKYVGVTANQYKRMCQFQLSFAQLKGKRFDKLADVAYDNGFADQSHFIRAFKEFTDTTPNDYLKKGLNGEK